MKKKVLLIVKCVVVMLPFIVIAVYSKFNMIKFVDNELPYFLWNKSFCNTEHEKKYNVLILGDSVANAAYIPEVLSGSTANLALGGTTPIDAYYILEEWLANNEAPQTVYISFLDWHFQTADWFWTRTMFMHRFNLAQNIEMLEMAKKYNEPSIITENYLMDFISYQLYLPNKYITSLSNGAFNQRYQTNITLLDKNNLFKGRYMKKGNEEGDVQEAVYSEFTIGKVFKVYYETLIEMCIQNNIQVRLVKLPLSKATVYTDEYITQVYAFYEQLCNEYPGITFDWIDNFDKNHYADQNHMNNHGALKFSNIIKRMYPEDFEQEFSSDRVLALNADICEENWVQDIFAWADCGPYTLFVYDGSSTFLEVLNDYEILDSFSCEQSNDIPRLYYMSKSHSNEKMPQITRSENGIMVHLNGMEYEWDVAGNSGLNFLVIDNFHNAIICEKKFNYSEKIYTCV